MIDEEVYAELRASGQFGTMDLDVDEVSHVAFAQQGLGGGSSVQGLFGGSYARNI